METEFKFPCIACGYCCEAFNIIESYQYLNNGDGVCKYLDQDRMCSIYTDRPDECNTSKIWFKHYASFHEYVYATATICHSLMNSNADQNAIERLNESIKKSGF